MVTLAGSGNTLGNSEVYQEYDRVRARDASGVSKLEMAGRQQRRRHIIIEYYVKFEYSK